VLSVVFGAIAQRSHFCTMGAISDVVNIGDWTRMRQWGLAVGIAMIGFAGLSFWGVVEPSKTLYASNKVMWLSAIVGGSLFGFGMVLASGCGSKTLVRMGGGSLKSLVVFVVLGIASFATLKGITAVLRDSTVDRIYFESAAGSQLPQILAPLMGGNSAASLSLGLLLGGALVVWALMGKGFLDSNNLLAGLGIGSLVVFAWWLSGSFGHIAEHPETLQEVFLATSSGRAEALSFVAPVAYSLDWLMFFSDKSKTLTLGIVSVVGVVAGSALMALWEGTFRWEGFGGTEDIANHLVGAALMGVGGVTALGCTVGQGLSGISTLSVTSLIAVAGIFAGAVVAFKYQIARLDHSA
jgi:uncharacterized membrane protein YedE/YeeE